jgi:hypothetical protein
MSIMERGQVVDTVFLPPVSPPRPPIPPPPWGVAGRSPGGAGGGGDSSSSCAVGRTRRRASGLGHDSASGAMATALGFGLRRRRDGRRGGGARLG